MNISFWYMILEKFYRNSIHRIPKNSIKNQNQRWNILSGWQNISYHSLIYVTESTFKSTSNFQLEYKLLWTFLQHCARSNLVTINQGIFNLKHAHPCTLMIYYEFEKNDMIFEICNNVLLYNCFNILISNDTENLQILMYYNLERKSFNKW